MSMLLLPLFASSARAAPAAVLLDPDTEELWVDLASVELYEELRLVGPGGADAALRIGGETCTPSSGEGSKASPWVIALGDSGCAGLFEPGPLKLELGDESWTLRQPATKRDGTVVLGEDGLVLPVSRAGAVQVGLDKGFELSVSGTVASLDGEQRKSLEKAGRDGVLVWIYGPLDPEAGTQAVWPLLPAKPEDEETEEPWDWCRSGQSRANRGHLVCLDLSGGTPSSRIPEGVIVPPNTPIEVLVRADGADAWTVSLTGTPGLWRPGDLVLMPEEAPTVNVGGDEARLSVSSRSFVPRGPGVVELKVKKGKADPEITVAELVVQETYAGAVRLGVGLSGVVDPGYEVVTVPGSQQAEIVQGKLLTLQPELVLGYAPFIRGSRVYDDAWKMRFAPYMGLGLVTNAAGEGITLTALRSVYLGAEVELNGSSSLTLAWNLRSTSRLLEGFSVGGPFDPTTGTLPLLDGYASGVGVVLSFSPDFFRVAKTNPLGSNGGAP